MLLMFLTQKTIHSGKHQEMGAVKRIKRGQSED